MPARITWAALARDFRGHFRGEPRVPRARWAAHGRCLARPLAAARSHGAAAEPLCGHPGRNGAARVSSGAERQPSCRAHRGSFCCFSTSCDFLRPVLCYPVLVRIQLNKTKGNCSISTLQLTPSQHLFFLVIMVRLCCATCCTVS